MLARFKLYFSQDDWDFSGPQFVATLIAIAVAFVVSTTTQMPEWLKAVGVFGLAPFGMQVITEIVETLLGKNPHVKGRVAIIGIVAGVTAFILPAMLISLLIAPELRFAGAATDIALVNGFSFALGHDARVFLLTQAVADDLAGLVAIISGSGFHLNFPVWFTVVCALIGISTYAISVRTNKVRIFMFSGFFTTAALYGVGIEPLLGMLIQAVGFALLNGQENPERRIWKTAVKNLAGMAATIGLFAFIATHLNFAVFVVSGEQTMFNLAMTVGKVIPTLPLMLGVGIRFRQALLGALMSATSGTVGLIFLEISARSGELTHELEIVGTSGIIMSIALCAFYSAISWITRPRNEASLHQGEN